MTSEDKQRMLELCQRIMVEEKYGQMIRLVRELNDIFDGNERQPKPARPGPGVSRGDAIRAPVSSRQPERVE